uniref:Uncharacterized protein n=1 Tax=viral metagenome TaxID=1070528 RepID=A0A6C0BIN1_9ZZZZ
MNKLEEKENNKKIKRRPLFYWKFYWNFIGKFERSTSRKGTLHPILCFK